MNEYERTLWRPKCVSAIVAKGTIHLIGRYDNNTVLKYRLINNRPDSEAATLTSLEHEAQVLERLGQHNRIIQFKGRHNVGILLEYLPHGSVEDYLSKHTNLSEKQKLKWAHQTAEGLDHIHKNNVIHQDLSLGNLLIDAEMSIRICDISGMLLRSDEPLASYNEDPEAFLGRQTDIHALGTIIYSIATGETPFPDLYADEEEEIDRRFNELELPRLEGVLAGDIIEKCWRYLYKDASEAMAAIGNLVSNEAYSEAL
jgi:serine/threonine protein kinase